jgi:hypothetical protein
MFGKPPKTSEHPKNKHPKTIETTRNLKKTSENPQKINLRKPTENLKKTYPK